MSRRSSSFSNPLAFILLLSAVFLLFVAGIFLIGYAHIAATLPAPEELRDRANTFKTTTIYDREGNLLYEIFPNDAGRRTITPLASISHHLINATLAVEDPNFYHHPGVDPVGVARAVYYVLKQDERLPGGSGIPQQLVKLTFLSAEKTLTRKLKEAILAIEISRRYGKDEILEIYLNHIPYGNLAFGAEAAAQTYFDKPASHLTLAESSLIAGLTQAPGLYDPYRNWDRARDRQADVLRLMVEHGFITPDEATAAWLEWEGKGQDEILASDGSGFPHPHFVLMVRRQLEQTYGADVVSKGGLRVTTTLDLHLQQLAEDAVQEGIDALQKINANANNAALVAIAPESGEIVALVGSPDFNNDEIDGQINMALAPRQTGSVIKPLTYLATFEMPEDYWTPAKIIMDEKTQFPDGAGRPPYVPKNYDGKFHGPVSVRSALANSYNIPAVKALQHASIPALIQLAERLGITTLTRPDYGLSLTLGGGEVSLLEMTGAFAVFANGGERIEPHAILTVETDGGDLLEDNTGRSGSLVMSPAHAFLITSILSDQDARRPAFGASARLLELPDRPVAAKTGTTDDWRDGWTVGYTPQLVTGVWVGNTDNREMNHLSGVRSAAPIWRQFMQDAHKDLPVRRFSPPANVVKREVCSDTGFLAHPECEQRRTEFFKADQLPPDPTPTP
ncbi:MAG TPA: PBP1A family penicillin-binding protein [Caldilineae bacterium]|nr:PBP1A family penicillin-binding protein [Caldilineae bacterium]